MSTREKILLTALKLFNTSGYQEVGVREIARVLDISPGNLSYHFSRKEDILYNLLDQLKETNNAHYTLFANQPPTLENFLLMLKNIFHAQYQYRGVFAGNQVIMQILRDSEHYDYDKNVERRKSNFSRILLHLTEAGQLKTNADDVEFLVAFISMFGRFWIMEAFLGAKLQREDDIINYYLKIFAKELSLFCHTFGKKINRSLSRENY